MAGNSLSNERVFPLGTVINGYDISGYGYEEGLEHVLTEARNSIESLAVQLDYNGNRISLTAADLRITEIITELLHGIVYDGTRTGMISSVIRPKQGQVINLSPIFDKTAVQDALQTALLTADINNDGKKTTVIKGKLDKPIIDIECSLDGSDVKKININVNLTVLHEFIAVFYNDAPKAPEKIYAMSIAKPAAAEEPAINEQNQNLIEKYSSMYDLDPALVTAVIYAESALIDTVRSDDGAVGLMQIMPPTGRWIADKIGLEYHTEMLYDPETNLHMGCWYLSYLMDRFDGNIQTVSAAYNAGPNKVGTWLEDERYSSDGINLHTLPYMETRAHIEKIAKLYETYKEAYAVN
jgi:soluble lytic murein transglycosylase